MGLRGIFEMIFSSIMDRKLLAVIISSALLFAAACYQSPPKTTGSKLNPDPTPTKGPSNPDSNDNMGNKNQLDGTIKSGGFMANLPTDFTRPSDEVGKRLLREYGSVFVARGGAVPPNVVVFRDDNSVATFQASLARSTDTVGGISIELQAAAMKALKEAVAEANQSGVSITPRGADAARRGYGD